MIHEILKILDTTDLEELEKQRITTDLLNLFNASQSILERNKNLCHCGKTEDSRFSPCCSLEHWHEKFS